jgi:hypothetical protein
MIRFLFLFSFLLPFQVVSQNTKKISLEIDTLSVKIGKTSFEFALWVSNNSKKAITMVAPGFNTNEAGQPTISMLDLGFNRAPYIITLTSTNGCVDTTTRYNISIYATLEEKQLTVIAPGERKKIGEIYVNNEENCFNRDKSAPYTVSVKYHPDFVEEVFTPDEQEKIQSVINRLQAASQRLSNLNMISSYFLPSITIETLETKLHYSDKILSRISKITLASNSVLLTR